MMHAYYKLGWSQRSSCALALATRQSWQRPHLQGMSVAKARQTRRSLLGCKYWNMVLWSGSGRGCFGYPAFARRSIEGRIEGPAQRFSLAVRHRFFWRCQKKWGRENTSPSAKRLEKPSRTQSLKQSRAAPLLLPSKWGREKHIPKGARLWTPPRTQSLQLDKFFEVFKL